MSLNSQCQRSTTTSTTSKRFPARNLYFQGRSGDSDNASLSPGQKRSHGSVTEEEWRNASRMLRTASWGAGFYLITTDILGPYGVGFALGTLGWGPGVALYTVFAFMAGYSGYLLWQVFLGLDSYEYPLTKLWRSRPTAQWVRLQDTS